MEDSGSETLNQLMTSDSHPDDNTVFGNYVASELRQLRSETRRRKLKLQIQKAILASAEEDFNEFSTYRVEPDELVSRQRSSSIVEVELPQHSN